MKDALAVTINFGKNTFKLSCPTFSVHLTIFAVLLAERSRFAASCRGRVGANEGFALLTCVATTVDLSIATILLLLASSPLNGGATMTLAKVRVLVIVVGVVTDGGHGALAGLAPLEQIRLLY